MAASKHEIIKSYWVQLYCDKCRSVMKPSELRFDWDREPRATYISECPHCGAEIDTGNIQYPYQTFEYLTQGVDVTEEEQAKWHPSVADHQVEKEPNPQPLAEGLSHRAVDNSKTVNKEGENHGKNSDHTNQRSKSRRPLGRYR